MTPMTRPQEPTATKGLESGTGSDTARYLYGVCRGPAAESLQEIRGIGEQPVELVAHLDLVALVSTVSLTSFGEEALRRNLEDLEWLETTVRCHDAVVHA